MVRSQKKNREVLSVSEINELRNERREIQETIKDVEEGRVGAGTRAAQIDVGRLKKEEEYLGRAIEQGSPQVFKGVSKDKAHERSKQLEEQIRENMPNRSEMRDPVRNPGAIMKNVAWEKNNAERIREWRSLQRSLNPHDPTATSVERLRDQR